MASIKEISGTYDRKEINKLTWPIAWSGAPDHKYEADLAALVTSAEEALRESPDAVAVEIVEGEVTSVVVS